MIYNEIYDLDISHFLGSRVKADFHFEPISQSEARLIDMRDIYVTRNNELFRDNSVMRKRNQI